jgi:natural product precursor
VKKLKKLELNRETLRNLTSQDLKIVQGGLTGGCFSNNCKTTTNTCEEW